MTRSFAAISFLALSLAAQQASAACVNRFMVRTEHPRQVVTFLTGKLTFQEAQRLSELINSKKSPALEWVTAEGKLVARQYGDLKVVRPMPVGCDGRRSGVVMVANFATTAKPAGKMFIKLDPNTTVVFDQQSE